MYLDISTIQGQQKPIWLLDSSLQKPVLHSEVLTLQRPVLHLDVSTSRNGKTSIVYYQTHSFFGFFNKKQRFIFFAFKFKITFEPVPFTSILSSLKINQLALLPYCLVLV
jgi:hypothetical protein